MKKLLIIVLLFVGCIAQKGKLFSVISSETEEAYLVQSAVRINKPIFKYPEVINIEGYIFLKYYINNEGIVTDASIFEPLTDIENRDFHKVALNTIKEFQYKPANFNGKNIGMWTVLGIEFKQNNVIPIFKSLNKYQINFYDNGQLYRLGYLSKDGSKHGEWIFYYPNGILYKVNNYLNGKLHGLNTMYYESGQIEIKENFLNGKLQGLTTMYYESGQIYKKGNILNGYYDGLWNVYYENGTIAQEANYINGIANGKWKTYNKDGNIKKIKEYKDGELLPSP